MSKKYVTFLKKSNQKTFKALCPTAVLFVLIPLTPRKSRVGGFTAQRKSFHRINAIKTALCYAVRSRIGSKMAMLCNSKLQIFAFDFAKQMTDVSQARKRAPFKMPQKLFRSACGTICAPVCREADKSFCQAFFKKRPFLSL